MLMILNFTTNFYFGSMPKSLFQIIKNAFFTRLCLFFICFLIILNDSEITQFFLIISLVSTLLVLITSLVVFFKEFAHFFFKNFSCYKFVFFISCCYFFFVTTFYAFTFLILQYNLDI